jgi:hypothetical protein
MARTGRPKAPLTVNGAERAALVRGARAATSTQACALRCKIVLAYAEPVRDWVQQWNDNPRPFVWKKTAEEILASLARYL